jgi:hypothetical protein
VARLHSAVLVILMCSLPGAAAFAQADQPGVRAVDQAPSGLPKTDTKAKVKKSPHKAKATDQAAKQSSEEAEKAARLAEGRKKFFEQSTGFDETNSDNKPNGPVNGSNGFMPSMGFKF